jgi:hypothetical protein
MTKHENMKNHQDKTQYLSVKNKTKQHNNIELT